MTAEIIEKIRQTIVSKKTINWIFKLNIFFLIFLSSLFNGIELSGFHTLSILNANGIATGLRSFPSWKGDL